MDIRVVVSSPPPLPPRSIDFHFGEKTNGEINCSIRALFIVAHDFKMYSFHMWNPIEYVGSSEVLNSYDDTAPLRELADLISKQESIGMAATLSWTQVEVLASGEKIHDGPRHPSLPSLPSSAQLPLGATASKEQLPLRRFVFLLAECRSPSLRRKSPILMDSPPLHPTLPRVEIDMGCTNQLLKKRDEEGKRRKRKSRDYLTEEVMKMYDEQR